MNTSTYKVDRCRKQDALLLVGRKEAQLDSLVDQPGFGLHLDAAGMTMSGEDIRSLGISDVLPLAAENRRPDGQGFAKL